MSQLPLVLLILDGWGYSKDTRHNAIAEANTPCWDELLNTQPLALLDASGESVGLPKGQMGNSEVGHMVIGAGRSIPQDLHRINQSMQSDSFASNEVISKLIQNTISENCNLHVMVLLSPGGIHSHQDHLFAFIKLAEKLGLSTIKVHAILDGRDTPPKSATESIKSLEKLLLSTGTGSIASISGRFYAMDRDQRLERTKQYYDAIVHEKSEFSSKTAIEALEEAYSRNETDEFVKPTIMTNGFDKITARDYVFFMNFRSDRARQISYALTEKDYNKFERGNHVTPKAFVSMTEYAKDLKTKVAFPKQVPQNTLPEIIANNKLKQLRVAETEKYAHVTFFFNGGKEDVFEHEDRILIPSPKVATYDQEPCMSAIEVCDSIVAAIQSSSYDVIIANFANADMVGHTGNMQATIEAIECLDTCLSRIITALKLTSGQCLITADHGNADCMFDQNNNQPHTAHTKSLVPLVHFGKKNITLNSKGTLADIAPTMLELLDIPIPDEMSGTSLLKE